MHDDTGEICKAISTKDFPLLHNLQLHHIIKYSHAHTHTHMCNQHFTPVHTEYEQPTDCAGQSTADYNAASDNV